MHLRKSFLFLSLSAFALITSCGNNEPEVPDGPGPGPGPVEPEPEKPELPTFKESDYASGVLGKFYAPLGNLTVSADSLLLDGDTDLELYPTKIEDVTNGDTTRKAVYYDATHNGGDYRLYFSFEEKMELLLEEKVNNEYVLLDSFMPDIIPFVGTYTGYGDSSMYSVALAITDEYSGDLDTFTINQGIFASGTPTYNNDYYFAKTYYSLLNDKMTLMVDIWDYEDDYLYYSCYLELNDQVAGLFDITMEQAVYISDVTFVYGDYFVDKDASLKFNYTSSYDEETYMETLNPEISIGEEKFTFGLHYDNGSYYHLKNDVREIFIQATPYGIKWIENNETKYYPFNSTMQFNGAYENSDGLRFDFAYDSMDYANGSLLLNGAEHEFEKIIQGEKLGLKTNLNGVDYVFTEFQVGRAIEVTVNGQTSFLLNYDLFKTYYDHTFESIVNGVVDTLIINDKINVTYKNKDYKGALTYDPALEYPYVTFDVDGSQFVFSVLDETAKAYTLTRGTEIINYFSDELVNTLEKVYTSGKGQVSFKDGVMTYKGENKPLTIEPSYDDYSFSYKVHITFKDGETNKYFNYETFDQLTEYVVGVKDPIETYIDQEIYDSLVGRYVFTGTYGDEAFELTKDGKFYADVLNETGDGLIYREEKEYHVQVAPLANGTLAPAISFLHQNVWVYLYKEGNSMLVFETRYVEERLHAVNGIYHNEDLSQVVFINRDKVYVNGEEVTVNSISGSLAANGTITINVTLNNVKTDLVFTLNENKEPVDLTFGANELKEAGLDLASFKGTYEDTEGNVYTFKDFVGIGGANDGYQLEVKQKGSTLPGMTYTEYVVVNRNGKLALKFSALAENYYLIYDNGTIKVEKEAGGLVPPPPPLL